MAFPVGRQGVVDHAVALQSRLAPECFRDDDNAVMAALTRPGVAGMQMGIIDHFKRAGLEMSAQDMLNGCFIHQFIVTYGYV